MKQLKIGRLDVRLDGKRVVMAGRLDDASAVSDLAGELPADVVVIDTAAVTFINSVGMREWTRLLRGLRQRGTKVSLEAVADVVMTQMNLIGEWVGALDIRSFHAQYACPVCGAEHAPLIDAVAHGALLRKMSAPHVPCPECGAASELADFPERYLTIFQT
jgi:anti-anti-sigma regulatory factor